ncbi:amidohydrolase family protein [Corynebacterium sp. AOP36-E1-14]|uniref:amidohydrolase family protein n=1 Tax=unclassified Corynebacterium TaxID=2624378 RepID=UPI003F8E7C20
MTVTKMTTKTTKTQTAGIAGIAGVLLDGAPVDITFDGPLVDDVRPHVDGTVPVGHVDLRGYTVLPATADPHAHLDKSRSWDLVNPPVGDLPGAVAAWAAAASGFTEDDILARARDTALSMLAAGTTAVRTHVDVYPDTTSGSTGPTGATPDAFRGVRALHRLRWELSGVMALQIVALVPPSTPVTAVGDLVAGALEAGADLVGGAPHLAGDPLAQTDALVDAAETHHLGCDLHVDEYTGSNTGHHRTATIHRYAERVTGWPAGRDRAAGHCCHLADLAELADPSELTATTDELVAADMPVIALPATNLYLQDAASRAIAPLSVLRAKGVRVAAGGDNVADPFNPTGRGDALETAALLVTAAHQTPTEALDLVTSDARNVMGLPPAGPTTGAVADLLCVRNPANPTAPTTTAPSTTSLIAAAPSDRVVITAGRLVAHTTSTTTFPHLRRTP